MTMPNDDVKSTKPPKNGTKKRISAENQITKVLINFDLPPGHLDGS